jgi:hypothetical protein
MKAREHTLSMLRWWWKADVDRADLAVRRSSGAMIWHRDLPLETLPLSWARSENLRQAEIYVRPARNYPWPLVFLDDLPVIAAARLARKYDALVVETSPAGGCHLWLSCGRALAENARGQAQRWLAQRIASDPASTSGEHLGRLAGFKNWKRGGTWVNVIEAPRSGRCWIPTVEQKDEGFQPKCSPRCQTHHPQHDTSESGKEWGWVCGLLEAGFLPHEVYLRLVERARLRRGSDAERYARLTIKRALDHVANTDILET